MDHGTIKDFNYKNVLKGLLWFSLGFLALVGLIAIGVIVREIIDSDRKITNSQQLANPKAADVSSNALPAINPEIKKQSTFDNSIFTNTTIAETETKVPLVAPKISESEAAKYFENFIENTKNNVKKVEIFHRTGEINGYQKREYKIETIKFDVNKTDSLLNPIIGVINISLYVIMGNIYSTQDEASMSSEDYGVLHYTISLKYSFHDGAWRFLKGTDQLGKRLDINEFNEEQVKKESHANPYSYIINWLQ